MKQYASLIPFLTTLLALVLMAALPFPQPQAQAEDPNPPTQPVKLIFIHHSTGENWLTDDYGNLGRVLGQNNYFVSDTNYGWGPDAIGDRTDIPNWPEWFASENTSMTMRALFTESGQNSYYTRTLDDPGGENQIIMFKSCFPNSALEGNSDDPPGDYEEMTVSGAKYVYNTILQYFATHPDKLFVVITAPPLSDREYADNARAFNNWLVNDWLRENDYPLNNVAVFDFYNILTGPESHHRYNNGQIEHVIGDRNTLYYPSEDDHPSVEGSQKATEEFIPMLNIFYHRWQGGGAVAPPAQDTPVAPSADATQPPVIAPPSGTVGLLDNFEGAPPAGTSGWEGFFQDNADTTLTCAPESDNAYGGAASLKFEFDAAADSWATCGFYFDSVQNWSTGQGISFYLRADRAGIPFDIDLYGGDPGGRTTYVFHMQTPAGSERNWTLVEVPWPNILRIEWEENPGTIIDPAEITGFSFGLSTPVNSRLTGTLWVDDLSLLGAEAAVAQPLPSAPQPTEPTRKPSLPCGGAVALPLGLVGLALWRRKRA